MKIFFSIFFCSAFYFRHGFSSKAPNSINIIDDGKTCVILSPARCQKNCDCDLKSYITFNPKTWYRLFLNTFKGKGCKCNKCKTTKQIRCVNGVCDKKNQKCNCDYCWVGEICDKFKNKNAPEFDSAAVVVSIDRSHPPHIPVTKVIAKDLDLQYCNGARCPCGEIFFKLQKDDGLFTIDDTGEISITRVPELSRYVLQVTASNTESDNPVKKSTLTVTINVKDETINVKDETDAPGEYRGSPRIISANNDERGSKTGLSHHRGRRSVPNSAGPHELVISAIPKLTTTYYFNKNEKIVFQVKAKNNDSTKAISNVVLKITSVWLTLENANITIGTDVFATGTIQMNNGRPEAVFSATVAATKTLTAEITGVVKSGITPLANLNLDLNATYTYDGNDKSTGVKSSPIVYGVFPEVNVTKGLVTVATYDDINVTLSMSLPLLNYHLLIELTSNVECFVFMEVKNVVAKKGSGIAYDGSLSPKYYTSLKSNGLNDRAVIDFGNITVTGSASANTITIDYTLGVKDHPNVANGSTHYAGAGLQAGPSVLWVEQQDFQITKIEPALEVTYNKSKIQNVSRIFIGDIINIDYQVDHTSTSEADASKVKVWLISKHLKLVSSGSATRSNDTHFYTTEVATLSRGTITKGSFSMKVTETITPLITIPIMLHVDYENKIGTKKFPLKMNVTVPLTGTPTFNFTRVDGSGDIVFGNTLEYELEILLTKMNSPLQVEFVLPKIGNDKNGTSLMHILSVNVIHVGANIKDENDNVKTVATQATVLSTSDNAEDMDQAVWKLGVARNKGSDVTDSLANKIKIRMKALVNEVQNLTSGTIYKIGVGVIGMPRMVWVGQLNATLQIQNTRQPKMNFLHTLKNQTLNEYEHAIEFNHTSDSDQYAYNVTFEYFLPPYVKYVSETKVPNIKHITMDGGRARFMLQKPMKFRDTASHSIKVKLDRKLSPKTGIFDFMVPAALTYTNYEHKRWQYWRSVTRSIHVGSRSPIIPKKINAHSNYYGRGIYAKDDNEVYVCMNQHLPSSRPACYKSVDQGDTWTAMDSRVGCVLGHHGDDLYALGRNQIIVIKYDRTEKDWTLLNKRTIGKLPFDNELKKFKDFTGSKILEPAEISVDTSQKWGATDEGLYYRLSAGQPWTKKAKWRL